MTKKKGQLTIFVLLGLVLLIAVSFIFYVNKNGTIQTSEIEKSGELSLSAAPIKNYVESCVKEVGEDAIRFIGRQGGYFELPEKSTKDFLTKTAYYFYENDNIMPSKEMIEEELSNYMYNMLFFCLQNFASFERIGFNVEHKNLVTKATIQEKGITFDVNLPLEIKKGETKQDIADFSAKIDNVRFKTIYGIIKKIVDEQVNHPGSICLSCLLNIAKENDLYVDMRRSGESTVFFIIKDNTSIVNNEPFRFIFANKYEEVSCNNIPSYFSQEEKLEFISNCLEEEVESADYSLEMKEIPDMEAKINEEFRYQIVASGIDLVFSDTTNLFDINELTGEIKFIPKENEVGNHTIWVHVQDDFGNEKYETFNLVII
ncbi:hypothetical protein CMO93_01615 [Candidatus Woesearchaeota archaeon]|nr:hypothetical protein [Candidatus Woesearchaeota archaeon]|tara:strand:- start:387 stop:1505 length:1119 start_codon:yes stop_codon:yes gene_type:complete